MSNIIDLGAADRPDVALTEMSEEKKWELSERLEAVCENFVLAILLPDPKETEAGIIIPDAASHMPPRAWVVSPTMDSGLVVGDVVLFDGAGALGFKLDPETDFIGIRPRNIIAKLKPEVQ